MNVSNTYELIIAAKNNDESALNNLVSANIPLVKSIVSKFLNRGVEYEDLLQIGSIGLIKAIQKFDTSFNVQFSTYAVPMIMGEIKRFLRDNGSIKVSRSLKELAYKVKKVKDEINVNYNRDASLNEIAQLLNVDVNDIVLALDAVKIPMSLDDKSYDEDNKTSIIDVIKDENIDNNAIVDRIMLQNIIADLPIRDRQIIIMRYFQDKTQTEIAKALNISQVQVSRLENKILKNLKKEIS